MLFTIVREADRRMVQPCVYRRASGELPLLGRVVPHLAPIGFLFTSVRVPIALGGTATRTLAQPGDATRERTREEISSPSAEEISPKTTPERAPQPYSLEALHPPRPVRPSVFRSAMRGPEEPPRAYLETAGHAARIRG